MSHCPSQIFSAFHITAQAPEASAGAAVAPPGGLELRETPRGAKAAARKARQRRTAHRAGLGRVDFNAIFWDLMVT